MAAAAFNPKDDPAIVDATTKVAKEAHPQPAKKPPPPPIPVSAIVAHNSAAEGEPVKLIANWATHAAFATTDSKFVLIPRATAGLLPSVTVPAGDEIGQVAATAPVIIAVHHWIEKFASAGAEAPSKFSRPVVHTEITPLVSDWEKDFHDRLLTHDHSTIFGVINFAEKNKLESLFDFAVVTLSCELRGKSAEEMRVALCQEGDDFTTEEIDRAAASYSWFAAKTTPK